MQTLPRRKPQCNKFQESAAELSSVHVYSEVKHCATGFDLIAHNSKASIKWDRKGGKDVTVAIHGRWAVLGLMGHMLGWFNTTHNYIWDLMEIPLHLSLPGNLGFLKIIIAKVANVSSRGEDTPKDLLLALLAWVGQIAHCVYQLPLYVIEIIWLLAHLFWHVFSGEILTSSNNPDNKLRLQQLF